MTGMQFSRRRVVLGTAALATAGTGLALGTREAGAQADISIVSEDATLAPEDGEVYAPHLFISGDFEYRLVDDPAEWVVYLLIADDESSDTVAVAFDSGSADAREDSGTFELAGPITAASFYSSSDFAVDGPGDTAVTTVPFEVVLVVEDASGDPLVQAREDSDVDITIEYGGSVASFEADAVVRMQDDESDPVPEAE